MNPLSDPFLPRSGAQRGVSRATAGRTLHVLGVQPLGERCNAVALRSILLPSDTTHGAATGGSVACVSVSRREHKTLSAPGSLQTHDRAGWLCACCLREFDFRRCQYPFGFQALDNPTLDSLPRTCAGPARRGIDSTDFPIFFFDSYIDYFYM